MKTQHFIYCIAIIVSFMACKPDKEEPEKDIPVTDVTLNKNELDLIFGDMETLIATVHPNDVTNKEVIWNSNNWNVVGVDWEGRLTVFEKEGEATITVVTRDGNYTDSCFITVKQGVLVTSIMLNKNELVLMQGDTETLIATVQPDSATNKIVIWESSNPLAATVNNEGIVTAVANGRSTITATTKNNGKKAICYVTIGADLVTGVTLNKRELGLTVGDMEALIATVQPDNATNKTTIWTSSNSSVATVNDNGLVTAIANGETTITATTQDGNKKAACFATVGYRAKWVGSYDCEEVYEWAFTYGDSGTEIYQTVVDVIAMGDSLLEFIGNRDGKSYTATVNSNGDFVGGDGNKPYITGSFHTDSLFFRCRYIAPGFNWTTIYKGGKLKNKK